MKIIKPPTNYWCNFWRTMGIIRNKIAHSSNEINKNQREIIKNVGLEKLVVLNPSGVDSIGFGLEFYPVLISKIKNFIDYVESDQNNNINI